MGKGIRLCIAIFSSIFSSQLIAADAPTHLPRYDLDMTFDTKNHRVDIRQRSTWTNASQVATDQLVLNFYPRYRIPKGDVLLLAKTLEMLRLNPNDGMDRDGEHGTIQSIQQNSTDVKYTYRKNNPCAVVVELPQSVAPGASVTIDIHCTIQLPRMQGRWGHWNGIHFLTFALPTFAYHNAAGWHAMPFVPWHQPFWNEAGIYTARIAVPEEQQLITPAGVQSETRLADGWKRITYQSFTGRDYTILCSAHYCKTTEQFQLKDGRSITINIYTTKVHMAMARKMIPIAEHALQTYSRWFGPYPYEQFTITESYFGWNGNECAGLVMIDERVFDMPQVGIGYIEYLLSHEICHQWWYNILGTNGYSETFMDEGPATFFTHKMLDQRRGKNNPFLIWPDNLKSSPNIRRENYRHGPLTSAIRRHELPPAAGQLSDFGNLFALFSGAYDRGSKVFGMIEDRLGEEAFMDFVRIIMRKYYFQVMSASDFKNDLEQYTEKPWTDFFDRWIYGNGHTDWSVERVRFDQQRVRSVFGFRKLFHRHVGNISHIVEVIIQQRGQYDEPTTLGFQFTKDDGYPMRIPIGPMIQAREISQYGAHIVPIGNHQLRITLELDREPLDIVVDPDRILLDSDRANNSWNRSPRINITPSYSAATDSDLTNDYDRWNINAGLWFWGPSYPDPWYTRSTMLGLRAGVFRTQTFQGGVYTGYRTSYQDLVFGTDGLFDHWPFPKTQVGYSYERRLAGPFFGTNGEETANRASIFARYVFRPTSSMYLSPAHYLEVYTTYQDNFLPFARDSVPGSERPAWSWMNGIHHRLNLYTPYWNPTHGFWLDLSYTAGIAQLNERVAAQKLTAELAVARKLPDGLGWASDVRLAARAGVAGSTPLRGQFFALGGPSQFRGFDLAERQGSWLWSANVEARLPVILDSRINLFDNIAGLRNLYIAPFYDVGAIYSNGKLVNGIAHALGVGFRTDVAVFSFIERATMRFDVAKTLNAASPFQFWFGLQHPF